MDNIPQNMGGILVMLGTGATAVSLIIKATFLLPLFIKESRVQNGLAVLRKQLLRRGIILTTMNSISLILLIWASFHSFIFRYPIWAGLLVASYGFGFLALTLLDYRIYHQKYGADAREIVSDMKEARADIKEIKQDVKDVKEAVDGEH